MTRETMPEKTTQQKVSLGKTSKEEIAQKPLFSQKDKFAFLSALILSAGSLLIHGGHVAVTLLTQNASLARAAVDAVESLTGQNCTVVRKDKRNNEIIIENALTLLINCRVLAVTDGSVSVCEHIASELVEEQSAATAYIRGAYLGSGSFSAGKYHLEFSFGRKTLAEDFVRLLGRFGITAKLAVRKTRAVVYTKDGECISDALALMGAAKAVLSLNALMAQRQMSEHLNRRLNCDMHNIDKQVDTGLKQCAFLKRLDLNALSPVLRDTAHMRLAHPDFSYEQLAELTGVSKSGMKNRLRRLREIYEKTVREE